MTKNISDNSASAKSSDKIKTLLFIGPKPPPIGGSPLTVQAMLDELANYPSINLSYINTSPKTDAGKKMTGFNLEKIQRFLSIIPKYFLRIRQCNAVLVFANDLFAITIVPFLLLVAKLFRKPFYLKPVGAGLDLFVLRQTKILQEYLLFTLRAMEGILAQTTVFKESLEALGCRNVHYLPGCRSISSSDLVERNNSEKIRLIFLGLITRQKGTLILLESMQILAANPNNGVFCDFYGPIHEEVREDFLEMLEQTPNTKYCGPVNPGSGTRLIAKYDILVLPTYHKTEGHPGVLIEAMHAKVPVITTQIRTISDLVTHGINGLLVPTQNSVALANAILTLALDPKLCKKMGQANAVRGEEFLAEKVVAKLIHIVFQLK